MKFFLLTIALAAIILLISLVVEVVQIICFTLHFLIK